MKYHGILLTIVAAGGLAGFAHADDAAKPSTVYENDPEIIALLENLGENEAIVLPASKLGADSQQFANNGRYRGGPGTRDYCNKLPYAAGRQTVLYAGGSHQTYRPNDVWEYHLGSNTWHNLFPPDGGNHAQLKFTLYFGTLKKLAENPRAELTDKEQTELESTRAWWKENVVLTDGAITTKLGGPIMPAHTWDAFTFDDRVGRLMWASGAHPGGKPIYHALLTDTPLADVEKQLAPNRTAMWKFDPAAQKWSEYRTDGPRPQFRGMGATMHYLPDVGKSIYYVAATNVSPQAFGMWLFDAQADKWEELRPNGGKDISTLVLKENVAPLAEQQFAYSPRHKKLVAVHHHDTFVYDVPKNEWSKVNTDERIYGHDAKSTFAYDAAADLFLLANPRHETPLAAFSLDTMKWEALKPKGAKIPHKSYGAYKGFYHPVHKVLVLHVEGKGTNWVYRHSKP